MRTSQIGKTRKFREKWLFTDRDYSHLSTTFKGDILKKMRYVPKICLETTVFNFYFLDKDGAKKNDIRKLFQVIKKGKYEVYAFQYIKEVCNCQGKLGTELYTFVYNCS